MQAKPHYDNVIAEISQFLVERTEACLQAGIAREAIVLDPGFGFGKTLRHNLVLLDHLDQLVRLGYPVLAGISRKSMLGRLTGRDVDQRLAGSVAAATIAAVRGASILRVHDVAETLDAVAIVAGMRCPPAA